MASIGRGRGWAKTTDQGTVLRRPGQSTSPKTCESDDIINKIDNLDLEDLLDESIDEIYTTVKSLQDPKSVTDKLWNLALEDRCFAIKFSLSVICVEDRKVAWLRVVLDKYFMRKLQEYSERQYDLHKENHAHFTTFVWMLGFAQHNISSARFRCVMCSPLLSAMSILLENMAEDNIETVAAQLYFFGMRMKEALDTKERIVPNSDPNAAKITLADIVNEARQILVNRNVSARSRALLLFIIDLANQQYQPFTGDLRTFYKTVLEPTCVKENGSSAFKDRDFNQGLFLYRLLSKETESDETESDSEPEVKDVHKNATKQQAKKVQKSDGTSAPVPRAIRGVGASENAKEHRNKKKSSRGHKDKLTDQEVWSAKQNTSLSAWGHDDRFHNDYE